jgi:hypothetical protein
MGLASRNRFRVKLAFAAPTQIFKLPACRAAHGRNLFVARARSGPLFISQGGIGEIRMVGIGPIDPLPNLARHIRPNLVESTADVVCQAVFHDVQDCPAWNSPTGSCGGEVLANYGEGDLAFPTPTAAATSAWPPSGKTGSRSASAAATQA